MKKLQRYSVTTKLGTYDYCLSDEVSALEVECNEQDEVIANQEGELVIYRKKLADAEAENERLRAILIPFANCGNPFNLLELDLIQREARAILYNREQEKQP